MANKIISFTDLEVWKEGHKLVLEVYRVTKMFLHEERYGLVDQMRRSSVSITSNIVEGFSRRGKKEKLQFYFMAKGSLVELQNQILIAKDIGYIDKVLFQNIAQKTVVVHKLLNGLIRSIN